MLEINAVNSRIWSKLGSRGSFGVAMHDLGKSVEEIILVTADLGVLTGLTRFMDSYPNKFINTGIAEQNMIGIAAGMAKEGHNVFATTYATFITMRSYEQVRLNLAYMNLNVTLVGSGSGLVMGLSGNSHYGIEDIALMRSLPGMVVLSPADGAEVIKSVYAAAAHPGPVYIRLTGGMNNPIVYTEEYDFQIGKSVKLKEGDDVTLFATGTMVHESLMAAQLLQEQGIEAAVVNMHTIKPLDRAAIEQACLSSKLIVTVEEHGVIGGLGSAVAEYKSTLASSPPQLLIGLPDYFGKMGEYAYLLEKYGLTGKKIAETVINKFKEIAK
ncbi:transketolase family protein [Saccharibacillus deserti]|uniref:transketolase family protein n=1 Tax=Saccharibacillus deserti TaxID=1634444 RepID=UPI0015556B09|nr:transketolase C-terminal domain-containing protein [Saccharibacillus deserti]